MLGPTKTGPVWWEFTMTSHFWWAFFCIKDNVTTTIYHYPLHTASSACCVHWFDLIVSKTMSPPPYTTIPLHPLHSTFTASTSLTFLHQRQCPHHHIPLFHCILHPLVWPFCIKDNVSTTIYHYSTASTVYCIPCVHWFELFVSKTMSPPPYNTIPLRTVSTAYCIHCVLCPLCDCIHWINWFDLFAPKTMSPSPYTTIPLHPLCTASTGLTFLHQRQCPYHHIPLFNCILHPHHHCIHCVLWFDLFAPKTMSLPYTTILLCPLHPVSTAYCVHCVHTIESPLCNSYTTWYSLSYSNQNENPVHFLNFII